MRRLIPSGCAINTQERFLGQINRAVVIVRHPIDVTGDLISITRDQLCERVFVARQRPFQQGVVRSFLGDHGRRHGRREIQILNRT